MFLSGCATSVGNNVDPWESWNRSVYDFNKSLDKNIAKPLASGYKTVTPDAVELGFSNVFSNLNDAPTMVNNLLQGKVVAAMSDLSRLLINSSFGLAGLWDPATRMGLEKHKEDFGQTLAVWGVESGPYVMLPLLGPSTLRDASAYAANPESDWLENAEYIPNRKQLSHIRTRNQVKLLELIGTRASLLKYDDLLKASQDEYTFVRDSYLQFRNYDISDGEISDDDDDCDEEDECYF